MSPSKDAEASSFIGLPGSQKQETKWNRSPLVCQNSLRRLVRTEGWPCHQIERPEIPPKNQRQLTVEL